MIHAVALALGATGRGGGAAFNAPGLPLWSAAVRATQAGTADTYLDWNGDSTVAGAGSGDTAAGGTAR